MIPAIKAFVQWVIGHPAVQAACVLLAVALGSGWIGYALHKCPVSVESSTNVAVADVKAADTKESKSRGPKTIKTDTKKTFAPSPCGSAPALVAEETTTTEDDGPELDLSEVKTAETYKSESSSEFKSIPEKEYRHFSAGLMFGVLNGGGFKLHASYQVADWLGVGVSVDPNFTDPKKTAVYVGPQIRF